MEIMSVQNMQLIVICSISLELITISVTVH